MNFYETSPQALEQFFPQDEEGYALTAFGFYFSFRFPDGYRLELRRRCAEICADYWRLCGRHLVWMITPKTCLWRRIPEGYAMQQWLQAFPNQDWVWSMIFHSGRIPSEAAEYQIVGLGCGMRTYCYSYLTLILPATWFAQNPGQHPIELFLRWSTLLQARDGSAGLGLIPPEDTPKRGRTSKLAAAFRKQFPGAELVNPLGQHNMFWGLLSTNWLTMIGSECIEKLGGVAGIKTRLANEALGGEIGIHEYPSGMIFSAGEAPLLYQDDEIGQPPLVYGPVARLLKPLRTSEPWGSWGLPEKECLDWLARFD